MKSKTHILERREAHKVNKVAQVLLLSDDVQLGFLFRAAVVAVSSRKTSPPLLRNARFVTKVR